MQKYNRHNIPLYMHLREDDFYSYWDDDDWNIPYPYHEEDYPEYEYIKEENKDEDILLIRGRRYKSHQFPHLYRPYDNPLRIDMESIYPPSVRRDKKIDEILNGTCVDFSNTIENISKTNL